MKTVNEVSKITGVSIRTLHYYDSIGLLSPSKITQSGYRLYDNDALIRLQNILLFRELDFSLKDIAIILNAPDYDKNKILQQQITLLEMQKEHIANLITFARGISITGVNNMDFSAFDKSKINEYEKQAKLQWGNTDAYKECQQKTASLDDAQKDKINSGLMDIFARFGKIKSQAPDSDDAQLLVKELQEYITQNYYKCTNQILLGLSAMYCGGGSMTESIDTAGGKGTGDFCSKAILHYCKTK